MRADEPPVVVEQTFKRSAEDVWKAITDRDLMVQWYFDNIPDFKAEVGFETGFDVDSDGRIFPHRWRIAEVEPGKKIAYEWWFEGYQGMGYVEFVLSQQDSGTKLTLTHHVRETFPDDIPEFRRESCVGGWEYFINENLAEFLKQ